MGSLVQASIQDPSMIGGFVSAPVPLSFQKSFGFGDRLGSATTVDGNIPSPNGA